MGYIPNNKINKLDLWMSNSDVAQAPIKQHTYTKLTLCWSLWISSSGHS